MVRMRFLFLRCGAPGVAMPADAHDLSPIPTRKELSLIDAFLNPLLPTDPTPSLDDIAAQPDVRHLGAPEPAPQAPHLAEPARIVVAGSDAALSAVVTRLMRSDRLGAEVAFDTRFDDSTSDTIEWTGADGAQRTASLPRVIFSRGGAALPDQGGRR